MTTTLTFILLWAQGDATNAREQNIAKAALAMRARLVETRRDFHMFPELSNREVRTSRVVAERLRKLGFDDVRTGVGRHGVVALLKGGRPGPVVAVRADMDALPIQETNDVPYKSKVPGVKHACGHDMHTTVGLGVAEVLAKMKKDLPGTVKFVFQGAEEGAPAGEEGGASLMIKEGVLENPRPVAIFGLHTHPRLEVGRVGYASGPMEASSDRFVLTVRGKKSHGAWPHDGIDAVVVAAELVGALQTIRSRRIDPIEPIVVSIGSIHGGNRSNILADEVKMEGTVRALDEKVRVRVKALLRDITTQVIAAHGATFTLDYDDGNPVTWNDPKLVDESLPALRRAVGAANLELQRPVMGAEDFAFFQKVIPGFYFNVGVGNKAKGITANYHTPDFDIDEDSLVVGVKVMAGLVWDHQERHAATSSAR